MAPDPAPHRMVELPGVRIAVRDEGSSTVPLVLLHGFLGGFDDFDPVWAPLSAGRRLIAPDHRGFARSDNPGAGYTFDALASDVLALLDVLDVAMVDLLGHSMGGGVALRVALAAPDRVRSLVLVDTGARSAGPMGGVLTRLTHPLLRLLGPARFHDRLVAPLARLVAGPDAPGVSEPAAARFRDRLLDIDPRAYRALGIELSGQVDLTNRLPTLAMPTTVVVGERDAAGLRAAARELAAHLPNAVLEVVADAGHSPFDDQPEAVVALLHAHLARVEDLTTGRTP